MEDFDLFREAFGTDDETFDLDGNGVVSIEDSFILADDFGNVIAAPVAPPLPSYTVSKNEFRTFVLTGSMRMTISHGKPFGITSLRLAGQGTNYAHPDLPLADWEWVWFRRQGVLLSTKLLEESFEGPVVERFPDHFVLTYSRKGLSHRQVDAEVVFTIPARGSSFDVEYVLRNGAIHTLEAPYAMLGFPGFANHAQVNEVGLLGYTRRARKPHGNFHSEGATRSAEYALLRQDVPGSRTAPMTSSVAMDLVDRTARLETTFLPPGDLISLFAAHTNKPEYMTSHLYVTMPDLEVGQSRSLFVRYELSATTKAEDE